MSLRIGGKLLDGGRHVPEALILICPLAPNKTKSHKKQRRVWGRKAELEKTVEKEGHDKINGNSYGYFPSLDEH
jgi:hypothetical protein